MGEQANEEMMIACENERDVYARKLREVEEENTKQRNELERLSQRESFLEREKSTYQTSLQESESSLLTCKSQKDTIAQKLTEMEQKHSAYVKKMELSVVRAKYLESELEKATREIVTLKCSSLHEAKQDMKESISKYL